MTLPAIDRADNAVPCAPQASSALCDRVWSGLAIDDSGN
jgi:hypothetical protein